MRFGTLLLLLLLISSAAFAAIKFPQLTGQVVDNANILSESTQDSISEMLAIYQTKTGDQIVVVTLQSLNGNSIEDYAYQLGRYWQLGEKYKNNAAILLIAPNERKVRIEVARGLEGKLTDAVSSQIIHDIILPDFKAGKMERGVIDGAQAIITVLNNGQLPVTNNQPPGGNNPIGSIGFPLLIAVFVIFCILKAFVSLIVRLCCGIMGRPAPKRFTSSRLGWLGNALLFSGGSGGFSGFGGGGGFGGGFSGGGGGGFSGGGASGGW